MSSENGPKMLGCTGISMHEPFPDIDNEEECVLYLVSSFSVGELNRCFKGLVEEIQSKANFAIRNISREALYITNPVAPTDISRVRIFEGDYLLNPRLSIPSIGKLKEECAWLRKTINKDIIGTSLKEYDVDDLLEDKVREARKELFTYYDDANRFAKYTGEFVCSVNLFVGKADFLQSKKQEMEELKVNLASLRHVKAPLAVMSIFMRRFYSLERVIRVMEKSV